MAALQPIGDSAARALVPWHRWLHETRSRRLLLGGAFLALLFGPGLVALTRLSFIRWQLDRRLAALEVQRAQLTTEQARLQSDPAYVEGLIRSTFKVSQPGEVVVPLEDVSGSDYH